MSDKPLKLNAQVRPQFPGSPWNAQRIRNICQAKLVSARRVNSIKSRVNQVLCHSAEMKNTARFSHAHFGDQSRAQSVQQQLAGINYKLIELK